MQLAKLDSQNLRSFGIPRWPESARKVLKIGENGTLQANEEFRHHVESNLLNRALYNWIFIVNGHSMKLNEITCRFSKSSDQVADIDPFATVLFSDARLSEMRYLVARLAFRLTWLSFLGLHVPGLSQRMLHQTGMIGGVLVI